jgi:hemolysin D
MTEIVTFDRGRLHPQRELAQSTVETEDGMQPLEPGMTVTAEIKTGRRRVIEYLLSPLLRYKHEGLRER